MFFRYFINTGFSLSRIYLYFSIIKTWEKSQRLHYIWSFGYQTNFIPLWIFKWWNFFLWHTWYHTQTYHICIFDLFWRCSCDFSQLENHFFWWNDILKGRNGLHKNSWWDVTLTVRHCNSSRWFVSFAGKLLTKWFWDHPKIVYNPWLIFRSCNTYKLSQSRLFLSIWKFSWFNNKTCINYCIVNNYVLYRPCALTLFLPTILKNSSKHFLSQW